MHHAEGRMLRRVAGEDKQAAGDGAGRGPRDRLFLAGGWVQTSDRHPNQPQSERLP